MNAITNTKIITDDGIIWNGTILYDNGIIAKADWADKVEIPENAKVYDADGLYTAPGFIDMHNHGCREYWFYENPTKVCEFFIKHGVTTVLPTFYNAMSMEDMKKGAAKIKEESKKGVGKIMNGLYMEGPFMSLTGSFANQFKWSGAIKKEEYTEIIESFGDMIRVWAIDPDRENIEEFMAYAKENTPQAIFAHGHSKSTYENIKKLKHFGVKVRTHITDSGGPKGRAQGTPGAGGDEFALYDPDMYAELIADQTAVHVVPGLMKLIVKIKGAERICLISDHTTCGDEMFKNNEEVPCASLYTKETVEKIYNEQLLNIVSFSKLIRDRTKAKVYNSSVCCIYNKFFTQCVLELFYSDASLCDDCILKGV